jgi:hypothetical protein
LLLVVEYTYSCSVSGSFGILSKLSTFLNVDSQNTHCVQASLHEYVICVQSVGRGYFHVLTWNSSSDVFIDHISDILVLSLAVLEYHCIEIKAIVHSIANIVIVTISSTKVKAFVLIEFLFL